MNARLTTASLILLGAGTLAGCGGGDEQAGGAAAAATPAATSNDEAPSRVCGLLTKDEVSAVLPGHDGGSDKDTSEASLVKDLELEHCQYLAVRGTDIGFLDVFVYTATSDAGVDSLPAQLRSCADDDCRKLDMGDSSFVAVWSDNPHVVVNNGRQILEITLNGGDAPAKSEGLVTLTKAAAGRLWP